MQRYILTEYADASPATREVYDDFMRTTGETSVPIWIRSLGHNAALARAYWERAKGTLFSGSLPLPLKEMIVFVVSARNGARYCSACHAQCVLNLDKTLTFENLESAINPDTVPQLPTYYQTVIDFALKVVHDPNSLRDEDFTDSARKRSTRSFRWSTWPPCSTSTPARCAWTWILNTAPSSERNYQGPQTSFP